tara:strand:- start:1371 stop:1745 length:375 start_codon:yes stop_codon:yes gene_type:complete
MSEDENFFVQVRSPGELRKEILISSKNVLMTLKKYEEINDLRSKKVESLSVLKEVMKEIKMLVNQLNNFLPKTTLRAASKKPGRERKESLEVKREIKDIRKDTTSELDKLERELASIEGKIGDL